MLKKSSLRRIAVASTALLILGILYFFPTPENSSEKDFIQDLVYTNEIDQSSIYLIDQNNYVSRASIVINSKDTSEIIEQLLETLIINGKRQDYIPNGFKPIIPDGTKILSSKLDENGLLKIDFSKEILNIKEADEEKMIEAIIYSMTSIKDVKKIMIFVEGVKLNKLPKSEKALPLELTRDYGVNKIYDLDNYKGVSKTTIYYVSKYNDNYYYVPVTRVSNSTLSKVEIIINELKSSPIYQTNLMSYLTANAELLDYQMEEQSINLSFNKYLLDDFEERKILEEVKYSIALSLSDSLGVSEIVFNVEDEEIESLVLKDLNY